MVVGGSCSVEGCKRQHMYKSLLCYKHKDEEVRARPEPESERPSTEGETMPFQRGHTHLRNTIAGIVGVLIFFLILFKLLQDGIIDDLPSGGCDLYYLCFIPFAATPALGRSSTGKFTEIKTSNTKHSDLTGITHCLHMNSRTGKKCRRMVMKKSGLCYQHQDSAAAEVYLEAIGRDASGSVLRYNVDGVNKAVSSKDIDSLVGDLVGAKKFWVVDLGLDEAEFVQFTYDGDIDDDGQRDGVAVFEHWRGGEMISRVSRAPTKVHDIRAIDRLRSMLSGEELEPPENPACEELGFCEFDKSGRCFYCFTYSPDWDEK